MKTASWSSAGAAGEVASRNSSVAGSLLATGMGRAAESIDSGAAAAVLERWVEVARTL